MAEIATSASVATAEDGARVMFTCVPADDGNPVAGVKTTGVEDIAGTGAGGGDGDAAGAGAGDDTGSGVGAGDGAATGAGAGGAGVTAAAGEVTVVESELNTP